VVVKTVRQSESCKGCSQARECEKIYERLGKAGGPSVAWMVLVAFLLPIGIFLGVLGVSERALDGTVAPPYETPVAFVIALLITTGLMLIVSTVVKRLHRNRKCPR